jgi:outer membrane murein-binding lipoprotein Lpp
LIWIAALFVIILVTQTTAHVLLLKGEKKIMSDLTKLQTSVDKLQNDLGTFFTSISAKLAALVPADPAQQAKIDAIASEVDAMDTKVQNFAAPTP